MIETRLIGSLIEIYTNGGNSWLTESFPTNFHTFFRRKVLTTRDSVDNYREVTAEEKAELEEQDAKWEKPDDVFIKKWNMGAKGYGQYNETTGYFELYDLTDIAFDEALAIYETHNGGIRADARGLMAQPNKKYNRTAYCRAILPLRAWINISVDCDNMLTDNGSVKIICFHSDRSYDNVTISGKLTGVSSNLRSIVGNPIFVNNESPFPVCDKLEDVRIVTSHNLRLSDCKSLTLDSISYLVEHATNTKAITVTLHPEAYARLTDELVAMAAEKQITFITT